MGEVELSNIPDVIDVYSVHCLAKRFGKVYSINFKNSKAVIKFKRRAKALLFYEFMCKHCLGITSVLLAEKNELFVDRIPKQLSLQELKDFFSKYGDLKKIEQERTYFEFQTLKLTLKTEADARKCLLSVNKKDHFTPGERVIAKYYDESKLVDIKTKNTDRLCVFIYNIHEKMLEETLFKTFSCYGNIKSFKILENGMGYVNYDNELSALKAVKYADRLEILGKKLNVILKTEKRKGNKTI